MECADSEPFCFNRSVTSSLAFFLGPICFWTPLMLALSWVAAYAAAREEPHVSARSAGLDGPRLTLAMVLEHGDHVVDIFDSGEALALALPDLLGVAAALGDCNSWISMATTTSTGSSSRFFWTWREGHSRSWVSRGPEGALLKSFTSSMATATELRVRGRLKMLLPVQSRQCEASTEVRASRNTRWRGRIYFRPEGLSWRGTREGHVRWGRLQSAKPAG